MRGDGDNLLMFQVSSGGGISDGDNQWLQRWAAVNIRGMRWRLLGEAVLGGQKYRG